MNEYAEKVKKLKLKASMSEDFLEVFNYFLDHLGEDDNFLDKGTPKRHRMLEFIATETVQQMLGKRKVKLKRPIFLDFPECNFIHGTGQLSQYIVSLLYFSDIDLGLLSLSGIPPHNHGRSTFSRFSCHLSEDTGELSLGEEPSLMDLE